MGMPSTRVRRARWVQRTGPLCRDFFDALGSRANALLLLRPLIRPLTDLTWLRAVACGGCRYLAARIPYLDLCVLFWSTGRGNVFAARSRASALGPRLRREGRLARFPALSSGSPCPAFTRHAPEPWARCRFGYEGAVVPRTEAGGPPVRLNRWIRCGLLNTDEQTE